MYCVAKSVLFTAVVVALHPASASASASLRAADGSDTVKEATHRSDIRIDGVIATVSTTQSLINTTDKPRMAVYTFQLPSRAAITSLTIQLPGGRAATATVVDAKAAVTLAPSTAGAKADVGLLRLIERETGTGDVLSTYELRVYPITKRRATTVKIRWVATMRYDDGRLTLQVPSRGASANLVGGRVSLSARPPRGASRLGGIRGGGKRLSARHGSSKRRYQFSAANSRDLSIETTPVFRSSAPLVSFAAVPMGRGFGAVAVSALTPLPTQARTTGYERVFVIIDVSRSMGRRGLVAAANMAKAVLRAAPPRARVEAILFDREAKRVFGELLPNLSDTRKIIARAIAQTKQRNGSDLGLALDVVRKILARDRLPAVPPFGIVRGNGASTLVAVITDGLTPVELTGKRAADRIGTKAIQGGEVLAINLVPDQAALPALRTGPLADLARRTGGRSIAVRFGDVATRGASLASELNGPAELGSLSLAAPNGTELQRIVLPKKIVAGSGVIRLGWYRGAVPKVLTLRAVRDRRPMSFPAKRSGPGLRAHAGGIALSSANAADVLSELVAADQTPAKTTARDLMLRASARHRSVTGWQSLVVLANDPFSRQRRAFAKRWGSRLHRRHAPPIEQRDGGAFVAFVERPRQPATPPQAAIIRGRTGSLDRKIVERLIKTYVVPRARACYEAALRRKPTLAGSLTVVMELARGEVQFAEMQNSTLTDPGLLSCVTKASYAMQVPRVALGATRDQISLVRYPLRLRVAGTRAVIDKAQPRRRKLEPLKLNGPLDGLPSR